MSKFAVVEKQFEYKGHDCICIFGGAMLGESIWLTKQEKEKRK